MSRAPKTPVFLQRAGYRQRRLRDAARMMPFVGLVLWLLPLSWSVGPTSDGGVGANGLIYIFGIWLLLIVGSAMLSSRMRPMNEETGPENTPPS